MKIDRKKWELDNDINEREKEKMRERERKNGKKRR